MQTLPGPSTRGPVLQPSYFTSSLYVEALREDFSSLSIHFHDACLQNPTVKPFDLFKSCWIAQGWPYMHFKVLDNRSRDTFIHVTLRLFLERVSSTEPLFTKATAVFAAYFFFYTQPKNVCPHLHSITHIPIPIDLYKTLVSLPVKLESPDLLPLKMPVSHLISIFLDSDVFYILPTSDLGAQNPRQLPREVVKTTFDTEPNPPKKRGRPSKRNKAMKAKNAAESLKAWTQNAADQIHPPDDTLHQYRGYKMDLLNALKTSEGFSALDTANHNVLERLRQTEPAEGNNAGLAKVQRAVEELNTDEGCRCGGLLGLLEGAGTT